VIRHTIPSVTWIVSRYGEPARVDAGTIGDAE
jgi:hypothetical protein